MNRYVNLSSLNLNFPNCTLQDVLEGLPVCKFPKAGSWLERRLVNPRARDRWGPEVQPREERETSGGSPGEAGSWQFPASPVIRCPIWNHLAPTTINPWQAPGFFCLLVDMTR